MVAEGGEEQQQCSNCRTQERHPLQGMFPSPELWILEVSDPIADRQDLAATPVDALLALRLVQQTQCKRVEGMLPLLWR